MEAVSISKFKATCLALIKRVKKTGQPILITRRGEPVAQVVPPPAPERPRDWLGSARETMEIHGDIIAPIGEDAWEILKDDEW